MKSRNILASFGNFAVSAEQLGTSPNPAWDWMKPQPLDRRGPHLEISAARLETGFFARTEFMRRIRLIGHRNKNTSVIRFRLRGSARATVDGKHLEMGPAAVIAPDSDTSVESSDSLSLMFELPTKTLLRAAGAEHGTVYPDSTQIGSEAGRHLRELVFAGANELARIPREFCRTFGRNLEKLLAVRWAAAVLEAAPPLRRAPPLIGRRKVQDLIDYAKGDHAEPLHVGDLAAFAGLGIRALEKNFRRYFEVSPAEFLRNLRLVKARALIVAGGSSVTEAAFDAGFVHLGHFSAAYHRKFGELPRVTAERHAKRD